MSESSPTSKFSDVSEVRVLCTALKRYFDSNDGTVAFITKVTSSPYGAFADLFSKSREAAPIFFRLAADLDLRQMVLKSNIEKVDVENLSLLFDEWDAWARWDPERSNRCRSIIGTNAYMRLSEIFRYSLNDIYQCSGMVACEPTLNDIYFRGRLVLSNADKNQGGPDELIISSPLASFILSINVLLRALMFIKSEHETVMRAANQKNREDILSALDVVKNTLDGVRSQFEAQEPPKNV